jgi:hypothetical protein
MKRGFWTGLIILLIIYTIVNLFFYESNYVKNISLELRYFIKFFILITVYLIGSFHLKLNKIK